MHRSASTQWMLILGILLTACADTARTGDFDADELPRLELLETLRIGSVDDPDYGFSAIGAVDVDRDGNIFLFEGQDLEIRVYNPEGALLRRIGRRGSGPGEFESYARMGVVGDTLWTIQGLLIGRISLFTRDGEHLMTSGPITGIRVPLQASTSVGMVMPVWMREDGTFAGYQVGTSSSRGNPESGIAAEDTILMPRVRFDATGAVLDTIGFDLFPPRRPSPPRETLEIGGTSYRLSPPPSDRPFSIVIDDGRIFVDRPLATSPDDAVFTVTRLDLNRDTVLRRQFRYEPQRYSEAALDTIAAQMIRTPSGGFSIVNGQPVYPEPPDNVEEVRARLRSAISYPEFMPPVRYGIADDDDAIWLVREDNGQSAFTWLVLHPDGTPRGLVTLPRNAQILWSSGDILIVNEPDEFDVPWVVKYRMR